MYLKGTRAFYKESETSVELNAIYRTSETPDDIKPNQFQYCFLQYRHFEGVDYWTTTVQAELRRVPVLYGIPEEQFFQYSLVWEESIPIELLRALQEFTLNNRNQWYSSLVLPLELYY